MTHVKRYRNGKVAEIQEDGETIVDIEELRQSLGEVKGNPKMISVLEQIITVLEQEV